MSDRSRERSRRRSRSRSRSRRRSPPPPQVDDEQVVNEEFKAFVGGISWQMDDRQLKEVFQEFDAIKATVQVDKYSGRSRGFGFVWFPNEETREAAIDKMHGDEIDGRKISVTKAVPKSRTAPGTPADALRRGDTLPREHGRVRRGPPPARYAPYDRERGSYDRYGGGGGDRGYDRERDRGRYEDRDRGYGGGGYSGGYGGDRGDRREYGSRYDGSRGGGYEPVSRYSSDSRGRGYDDRAPPAYGAPPPSSYGSGGEGDRGGSRYGDRAPSYSGGGGGGGPPPAAYGAGAPVGGSYEPYVPAPYGAPPPQYGAGAPSPRDPSNGAYYEPGRYDRDAPYERPPR